MADIVQLNVDNIINRLWKARTYKKKMKVILTEEEIKELCSKARDIIITQPMLLDLSPPLKVCGDIHGQFYDLLWIFEKGGVPPDTKYLFLGDYVDRGRHSIETMCLLLAFKIKFPDDFFLLRGNHEDARINKMNEFYDDCTARFNTKVFKAFTDMFN